MKSIFLRLSYFFLLVSTNSFSQLASVSNGALHIKPVSDFQITGDGSSSAWHSTDWVDLPKRGGNAPYITRAKLLYAENGLYLLFHCEDKIITATLQQDFDTLWREDVVEIFLWTEESFPLYFEYQISPLNHELVLMVPNFSGDFMGWRPWQYEGERKTQHEVTISKDDNFNITGWMAEIFIPFTLLKPLRNVPPKKGTQWRINMYRIDYDETPPSRWAWKAVKTNFHDYKSFGKVAFD